MVVDHKEVHVNLDIPLAALGAPRGDKTRLISLP